MSKTLEQKVQELQQDYLHKLKELQEKQDWHSIGPLGEQLQKSIAALIENHQKQTATDFHAVPFKSKFYRHFDCTIDLDHFVYDGDKSYFEDFFKNPMIAQASQAYSSSIPNSKKELLKRALRLSAVMAPKIFKSIDRCKTKLGLNTNHLDTKETPTDKIFVVDSKYQYTPGIKTRLLRDFDVPYECSKCKNEDFTKRDGVLMWKDQEIVLQLEHKNGIHNDNRLDNLEFLCPNCHSQTSTYCGRNNKKRRATQAWVEDGKIE
jgi:predicted RNA-binding Zn-ribbon protein involved in translation (DUF1610 family)